MKLKALIGQEKGKVVSIVGAGGKTSFLFSLAQELRFEYKVLVTTTTKIFIPKRKQYDFIEVEGKECLIRAYCRSDRKGIYVLGSLVNNENKLSGLHETSLINISKHFDYVLIEADGSKGKPIKGWNDTEPVICSNTTATIGVVDIQVLGKEINDEIVHRMDKFLQLTGACRNQSIELNHLEALILSPKGLFKNASGDKVLFINKLERDEDFIAAAELIKIVKDKNNGIINKIVSGSLKNNDFKLEYK
jgi:probable selenium-dependent hydroxylase accessory protein YqeC